jgi:hypothetical protein
MAKRGATATKTVQLRCANFLDFRGFCQNELDCHLEMKLLFDECAPRNSLSVSGNRFIPWNSSWVVAGFLRVLTFIGAHHLEFQSTWHARFASG